MSSTSGLFTRKFRTDPNARAPSKRPFRRFHSSAERRRSRRLLRRLIFSPVSIFLFSIRTLRSSILGVADLDADLLGRLLVHLPGGTKQSFPISSAAPLSPFFFSSFISFFFLFLAALDFQDVNRILKRKQKIKNSNSFAINVLQNYLTNWHKWSHKHLYTMFRWWIGSIRRSGLSFALKAKARNKSLAFLCLSRDRAYLIRTITVRPLASFGKKISGGYQNRTGSLSAHICVSSRPCTQTGLSSYATCLVLEGTAYTDVSLTGL